MPHNDPSIQKLLEDRYYLKDKNGNLIENDPEQVYARVARFVANAELNYTDNYHTRKKYEEKFYNLMKEGKFLPNTPALINAGKNDFCLFACFTLPIEDSMEGIYDALKQTALIARGGGGWGINFSPLREENAIVSRSGNGSSGPIPFMRVFNESTNTIKQGGVRRGASIAILNVDHPDIMKFISCKDDNYELTNFNISVGITDEFIKAVKEDKEWELRSPVNGKVVQTIKAKEIWNAICEHAWRTGEPGIIHLDNINNSATNPFLNKKEYYIDTCNPCVGGDSEILLENNEWVKFMDLAKTGDSVNVVAIDPGMFPSIRRMDNPRVTNERAICLIVTFELNGTKRKIYMTPNHNLYRPDRYTKVMARDLKLGDEIYTYHINDPDKNGKENYVVTDIKEAPLPIPVFNGTVDKDHNYIIRCGEDSGILSANCGEEPLNHYGSCVLGSMNLVKYFNEEKEGQFDLEGFKEDVKIAVRFLDDCIDASSYPIPEIEKETKSQRRIGLGIMGWADYLISRKIPYNSEKAIEEANRIGSILQDAALKASRELAEERGPFPLCHKTIYKDNPVRNATRTMIAPAGSISRIAGCSSGIEPVFAWQTHHKLSDIEYDDVHWAFGNPKFNSCPEVLVTAHQVSPIYHLKHVETFNKYIDAGISKTINLPNSFSKEEVSNIFMQAIEAKIKGITIYRDGCRIDQPLSDKSQKQTVRLSEQVATQMDDETQKDDKPCKKRKRGPLAFGPTHKIHTPNGKAYVTINYVHEEDDPVEIFIRLGHQSTPLEHELAEWAGRLISLLLKYNVPIEDITKQAKKIIGDGPIIYNGHIYKSLPQLVSYFLGIDFVDALNSCSLSDDNGIMFEPEFSINDINTQSIQPKETINGEYCYNCGEYAVIRESGCLRCTNCDWERCG